MRGLTGALTGAVVWWALIEGHGAGAMLFGGALGAGLAHLVFRRRAETRGDALPRIRAPRSAMRRLFAATRLVGRFARELVIANVQQLRLVLAPRLRVRPRWVIYPTELESPILRTLLGLMISLTPGTVTADLRSAHLVVHVLDTDDEAEVIDRIRDRFEAPLLVLERGESS